ncbi:Ada metal-binding domain-containing protein [Spirosoma linguale]|uniref:Ada DNA repair metal-binding domain-containing protein n=1 Tax=Spirosoma linguale (strain ATCC 33905 / DSM 74 / LMG 10896 / Claus 1) TaxID=504472 RepID=D2QFF0_SPILD|nr:hypothetical protein Slin_0563 [Spirosoma linguale DSM 74]
MIRHTDLGTSLVARRSALFGLVKRGEITLGGYRPGKIYGRLHCRAGKRMKVENRVFFRNETEAIKMGFRPCGLCMSNEYRTWKQAV